MSEIQRLRDRVEELEELLGIGRDDLAQYRDALKVKGSKLKILGALMKRNVTISRAALLTMLQGARPGDISDERLIDVHVCTLRKRLPTGVTIRTDWGVGYYMDRASKDALRRFVAERGGHADEA